MKRRVFLKNSVLGIPALAFMPALLNSCKKDELFPHSSFSGSVAIIGAGAAGMYAAYLLNEQGINVKVYEASDRYGGRIRPLNNFSDFTIELGAETIHGNNSSWYDLITSTSAELIAEGGTDFFRIDDQLIAESQLAGDPDFHKLLELMNELGTYSGADVTAAIHGNLEGITERIAPVYNAMLGNDSGTSNTRLGMAGVKERENLKVSGNQRFRVRNRDLLSIMEERFAAILNKIHLNTPIISVDYNATKIKLIDNAGNGYEADRVIVTVPIPILFNGEIDFNPNLPPLHLQALGNIGMDNGLKIVLRFSSRFWDNDTRFIYGEGPVPKYWVPGAGGKSSVNTVLTAFVMGEKADALSSLGNLMVPVVLDDLDTIFGNNAATSVYLDAHIQSWGNEPFIQGAFSYPKPGTGVSRNLLADSVDDKLFFAGEATHTGGHFGTVHGAMETALRAVTQVLKT